MSRLQINPWLSMWMHPRETIQAIISFKPSYHFILLAIIVGWPAAIQLSQIYAISQSLSLPMILLITVLGSPILGTFGILIFTTVIYLIGKLLGSQASFSETKCAVAWSNIPGIFSVISYAILIAYFKEGWFNSAWINMPVDHYMVYILFCLFLAQIVAFGWTIYLFIQSIAQAHSFSIWKSIANLALACLVFFGVAQFLS